MTHPINGIDDLIYVVLFGAHAYCVGEGDARRRATGDDVFTRVRRASAWPATTPTRRSRWARTTSSSRAAQVAIADPLGMYIRRPNLELFS